MELPIEVQPDCWEAGIGGADASSTAGVAARFRDQRPNGQGLMPLARSRPTADAQLMRPTGQVRR